MLLAIDVGNTQTHVGVFKGEELYQEWRASTDATRTADELALLFGEFLSMADLSLTNQITGVVVCSVVPRATQELRAMTQRYLKSPALVVEPGVKTGIAILMDHPREVGADRIANAVAANVMFPGEAVVVVDFGTAITVDAISPRGEYLGGLIAPGIDTVATALFRSTAQLRRVELVAPSGEIGKNTIEAIQGGIVYGTAALTDGLVERVKSELPDARVVATGGLAGSVVGHCKSIERIEPTLTLEGLRLIFERNAQ